MRRHQGLLLGIWKTGKYFLDYSLLSDEEVLEVRKVCCTKLERWR